MADTDRLHRLTDRLIEPDVHAKLVTIGDRAQLPSIGAGGMFDPPHRKSPRESQLSRSPSHSRP